MAEGCEGLITQIGMLFLGWAATSSFEYLSDRQASKFKLRFFTAVMRQVSVSKRRRSLSGSAAARPGIVLSLPWWSLESGSEVGRPLSCPVRLSP